MRRGDPLDHIRFPGGQVQEALRFQGLHLTEGRQFYHGLSIQNAMRPQTLFAYDMIFELLNHLHGALLRLRVENQLGFKMVKWIFGELASI